MPETYHSRPALEPDSGGVDESVRLPTSNLPTRLTALIGRQRETASAAEILRLREVRLLALTGPGEHLTKVG